MLLLCGDLTSKGDLASYRECTKYLVNALNIGGDWTENTIHIVPGNHDIDRMSCDPSGIDLSVKFKPLAEVWNSYSLPILTTGGVRTTLVRAGKCQVDVYSLNSCVGCGEMRSLPDKIAIELDAVLKKYAKSAVPSDAFEILGEQLDTPAFAHEDIETLAASLGSLSGNSLPIVLAHHNILPQSLLRLAIYTEVINAGAVRTRLVACKRPIIYCHGHIHTDAIEQITSPRTLGGTITAISAPPILVGFNLIEIAFSREHTPIGCTIVSHRIQDHGGVEVTERVRIPLVSAASAFSISDKVLERALSLLTKAPERVSELRKKLNTSASRPLSVAEIIQILLEAEWMCLVIFTSQVGKPETWHVSRR